MTHYATSFRDGGGVDIIEPSAASLADPNWTPAKAMFELTRKNHVVQVNGQRRVVVDDPNEHFDPAIHTLSAIAAGLPNHHPAVSRPIELADLPADRWFRAAWEDKWVTGKQSIVENIKKARIIQTQKIADAAERAELGFDKELMRAYGNNAELTNIVSRRQTMRNAVASVDVESKKTPVAIKATWPAEL